MVVLKHPVLVWLHQSGHSFLTLPIQLSITRTVCGQTPIYATQQKVPLNRSQVYITSFCWHHGVSLWLWRAVIPHRQSVAGRSSGCEHIALAGRFTCKWCYRWHIGAYRRTADTVPGKVWGWLTPLISVLTGHVNFCELELRCIFLKK